MQRLVAGSISSTAVMAIFITLALTLGHILPGGVVAFASGRRGNKDIYLLDANSAALYNLTHHRSNDHNPVWSPDGTQIAFISERNGNAEIYVMRADGGDVRQVTHNLDHDRSQVWSADSQRIAYVTISERERNWEIYVVDVQGGDPINLTQNPAIDGEPAWSPDGRQIAFYSNRDGIAEIYTLRVDCDPLPCAEAPRRLTFNDYLDESPVWSPDGKYIAFETWVGPNQEVQVVDVDCDGIDCQPKAYPISLSDGLDQLPAWSPDGREIAFRSSRERGSSGEIYMVSAKGGDTRRVTYGGGIAIWNSFLGPSWSPSGNWLAFVAWRSKYENTICLVGVDGQGFRCLPDNLAWDESPMWRP